jgi:hypothetical protein
LVSTFPIKDFLRLIGGKRDEVGQENRIVGWFGSMACQELDWVEPAHAAPDQDKRRAGRLFGQSEPHHRQAAGFCLSNNFLEVLRQQYWPTIRKCSITTS